MQYQLTIYKNIEIYMQDQNNHCLNFDEITKENSCKQLSEQNILFEIQIPVASLAHLDLITGKLKRKVLSFEKKKLNKIIRYRKC